MKFSFNEEIIIGDRRLGRNHKPFIVAEMSGNHNQSIDKALAIVDAAAKAGADALKLQTYTPDTMTIDVKEENFKVGSGSKLWEGRSLYDLYKEAQTPWDWHKPIMDRCREHGLLCFSSPFDATAVDFLESLNVPAYKIASFENTDLPLARKIATTGKPIIVSTGMASVSELNETVETLKQAGCKNLILLKCTSTYPATPTNSNIKTIPHMRELFGCQIGLSDHTLGVGVSIAAVALGAIFIEKHFTLDRKDGGVDSTFSLEPQELASLVTETERAWQAMGDIQYGPVDAEKPSLQFRRSLYFVENLKSGETITSKNVRSIRPGLGLAPKYIDVILGMKVKTEIQKGTPVSWDKLGS